MARFEQSFILSVRPESNPAAEPIELGRYRQYIADEEPSVAATLDLTSARIKQIEFTPLESTPEGVASVLTLRRLVSVECIGVQKHGLGIMITTRDTLAALTWPANTPGTLAAFIEGENTEQRHVIGRVTLLGCVPVQHGSAPASARLIFAMPID